MIDFFSMEHKSVKIGIYYFLIISEIPDLKVNCKNHLHTPKKEKKFITSEDLCFYCIFS